MARKLLRGLAVVAVFTAATLAAAGTAGAQAPTSADATISAPAQLSPEVARTVTGAGPDARQQALAEYWTPARMLAAKPASELASVKAAAAGTRSFDTTASQPQGPAGQVMPAAPKTEPKAETTAANTQTVAPLSYNPNYPIGHPVARTSGKVFFTQNGGNYVCSAGVVNTEGKSIVWTAGHCVASGTGSWSTNWTFVPNYVNGSAPFGYWYSSWLWTTTAWFYNSDFANDVGAAVIDRNGGYRIADYLGAQGIAWNQGSPQFVYAFGYPQASPFNGAILIAEYGYAYNNGDGTIYQVNDMTGGSSGGYWLMAFDGNWGYINGHNDFKYNGLPQYMFSPYYGNQVASLYNDVRYISA